MNDWLQKKVEEAPDEAVESLLEAIAQKTPVKVNDGIVHISEIRDEIEKAVETWGKLSGISTGFHTLDRMIGGLDKGHVILIGGDTSMGKSALAGNIAVNVGKRGQGVLFITLEMLQKDIGARLHHINGGKIDDLNIMFQSEYRIDYRDLEPLMKKGLEEGKIELVILDYMQYLGRGMTHTEVAKMSKEFKSLALLYEVPFLVIVSLRKPEGGKGKRKWTEIEIEDFMGTGAIGYDCDIGMITSRKNLENEYDKDKMFVKILKTRNTELDYDNRVIEFDWDKTRITETPDLPSFPQVKD